MWNSKFSIWRGEFVDYEKYLIYEFVFFTDILDQDSVWKTKPLKWHKTIDSMLDLKKVISFFVKNLLWTVSVFGIFESWIRLGYGPFVNEGTRRSISVGVFRGILELGGPRRWSHLIFSWFGWGSWSRRGLVTCGRSHVCRAAVLLQTRPKPRRASRSQCWCKA